jgi:hypothetical protein
MAEKSQAERLAEELLKLKPDVTAQDRTGATHICGKGTISKYLNGNVMDNDTATKLITFFKAQILKREKALAV